jgi:uncharacterized protein
MKICTIPGLNGSGPAHWQTRWEHKYGFVRIEQEDWDHPVFENWQERLVQSLERDVEGEGCILVAHSLGCLLTVKAMESIRSRVRGVFLVAPPDRSESIFPKELKGFEPLPRRALGVPGRLIYSENDPYAKPAFSEQWARTWGFQAISIGCRGHINGQSELGDWDEGYDLFQRFVESVGHPA